ncbi:hypothetical protein LIER_05562 [Lithospermum erythrorhizon]|uniref:Uncharacterized protein n=1 Tax=Lithospermum erythrorhizon TaxID=34254 RepID=A0AAV3P150_LITER
MYGKIDQEWTKSKTTTLRFARPSPGSHIEMLLNTNTTEVSSSNTQPGTLEATRVTTKQTTRHMKLSRMSCPSCNIELEYSGGLDLTQPVDSSPSRYSSTPSLSMKEQQSKYGSYTNSVSSSEPAIMTGAMTLEEQVVSLVKVIEDLAKQV